MAKYKKLNEAFGERFLDAIFRAIGRGIRPIVLSKLSQKDPEMAKLIKKIEKDGEQLKKHVTRKSVRQKLTPAQREKFDRGEWPF
jgi:hypothetical protein